MDSTREEFVQAVGGLLRLAKPHLVTCEYEVMVNGKEDVKVNCRNGYCYRVNITGEPVCNSRRCI